VPASLEALLSLPGVGRYTAGAIASIAFDVRAPILDGNVVRVLCRIDGIEDDPRERGAQARLWARAEEILPERRIGDFNQSLMELGATICIPKKPHCLLCPMKDHCAAFARGIQDRIPPPKKAKELKIERRRTICVRREDGAFLMEQRPAKGRWAGMWQFATVVEEGPADAERLSNAVGVPMSDLQLLGSVKHTLTHRQYHFDVFIACTNENAAPPSGTRRWLTLAEMESLPFSKPQLEIRRRLELRDSSS
jgi:A/G-specific adenine glycosylase